MCLKKVLGWALIHGTVIGVYMIGKNNGFNLSCLKRKGRQLTRKVDNFISNIDENSLTKYKQVLVTEYNKLKQKIDNLTIKDIKDYGSDVIDNILNSIDDLKTKLITAS